MAGRTKQTALVRHRMSVRRRPAALRRDLEALYPSRYGAFVRVATAITGTSAGGVEAVQEAFVQALASLGTFRGEAPLEAWVWRIVVNTALAQRREPQPESLGRFETPSRNGHDPDELGVRRWIAALPERQRLVVFLRYYADLDYRGIAVALGVEVGTISATLSAAHAALRARLRGVPL
jgi:RNA polymerase sigma factor (sigma-70 family)